MPDPIQILEAMAAAALTAAALLLVCAWPWRAPRPGLASAGSVFGVGLGFLVGCWFLGLRPHWPPQEDQGRLLLILFPAVIGVELLSALVGRLQWPIWLLRLAVAVAAAPVLLHHTIYLADLSGPGTREWTPARTWIILGGLAAALAGVWAALALLVQQRPGRSVPLAVALACAGAAVTVMLSGYASGGQIGLSLAAALAGSSVASLVLSRFANAEGVVGLGIVGLYALLVMGRFFGELTTANACLLFFGLLLCWLPELPYVRRLGPRLRGLSRIVLVAVPVAVALALAQQKFAADSRESAPGSKEPSIQDYMDLGK